MFRIFKWLIAILLFVAVVTGGFLHSLNRDPAVYLDVLKPAIEKGTGRKLEIGGDVRLSLFPDPTLILNDVSLSNAVWGSRPEMVRAKKMEAQLDLRKLVSGDIHFRYIRVRGADVLLEQDGKGRGNWEMGGPGKEPDSDTGGVMALFQFGRFKLDQSVMTYRNGTDDEHIVRIDDLTVKPLRSGLFVESDLSWKEHPFQLIADLNLTKKSYRVSLKQVGLSAEANGTWTKSDSPISLVLNADQSDVLNGLFGWGLPDMGPIKLSGNYFPFSGNGPMRFKKIHAKIRQSDAFGEVSINTDPVSLKINAMSDQLVLQDFTGEAEQTPEKTEPASKDQMVFSGGKIPLDWMKGLDISLDATVKHLELGPKQVLADARFDGLIKNQRLALNVESVTWAGSLWSGRFVFDGGDQPPSVRSRISSAEASLLELIPGSERWMEGGKMKLNTDLYGKGDSVHAIASSLGGMLDIELGQTDVAVSGLKLVAGDLLAQTLGALRPKNAENEAGREGFTRVDCAIAHFDISGGLASAPNTIGIESKYFNMGGEGKIDLGKEEFDLHFVPKPRKGLGISLSTVSDIVMLGGRLNQPVLKVGGKELLKSGASVGAALATGGTSLLVQSLFNRITAEEFSCEQTRTRITGTGKPSGAGVPAKAETFTD